MLQFPHLKAGIEQEYLDSVRASVNPYPHAFLESYLLRILAGEIDGDRKRAGEILDALLMSKDEDLASAALTSVVEMIAGSDRLRTACDPFLGPTARQWIERLGGR